MTTTTIKAAATTKPGANLELCAATGDGLTIEAADGAEKKTPAFTALAYTGGTMRLPGWPHPVAVDLAGLSIPRQSRPILRDHDAGRIVGHTAKISAAENRLTVEGTLSAVNAHAEEVAASARNGFPWQMSIGASADRVEHVAEGRTATVNGQTITGPAYIARQATLKEISFVALGADDKTSARVAAQTPSRGIRMTFNEWIQGQGFDPTDLTEQQTAALRAGYDAEHGAGQGGTATDTRNVTATEIERQDAIMRICGDHREIAAAAIREGWDVDKARLAVLRASRGNAAPNINTGGGEEMNASAIEAAMCMRGGMDENAVGKQYDERTMNAATSSRLRGVGLHYLIYATLAAAGRSARPGSMDNDTIRAAFDADRQIQANAGGFSTVSLSGILGNVANKSLLDSFRAFATTWRTICAVASNSDFKEHTRYRMTGIGKFQAVGPDGEIKHITLGEDSYTSQLDTEAAMVMLTRKMIVNDDLSAFMQLPRLLGRLAGVALERQVYTTLLANASSFFGSDNKNYKAGANTALGIDSVTTAEQLFMDQVDKNGDPILIDPRTLLVPTSLKTTGQQLINSTEIIDGTSTAKQGRTNPHANRFALAASPWLNSQSLTSSSAKAWYLFADPAQVAALEVAFLNGRSVPTIERGEANFDQLGMGWRSYFDFGVALGDHRGAVKMLGEAE